MAASLPLLALANVLLLSRQRLLRMVREYPRQPVLEAVEEAVRFGLFDLDRLERMVLRHIGRDHFSPPALDDDDDIPDGKDDDNEG